MIRLLGSPFMEPGCSVLVQEVKVSTQPTTARTKVLAPMRICAIISSWMPNIDLIISAKEHFPRSTMTIIKCAVSGLLLSLLVLSCDKTTDPEVNPALRVEADSIKVAAFDLSLNSSTVDTSTFTITNVGDGTLSWSVSRDQEWIVVFPDIGTTAFEEDEVAVYVNTENLTGGTHTGSVSVHSSHGVVVIPVEVYVPVWTGRMAINLSHFGLFSGLDWFFVDTVAIDFYFEIDSNNGQVVGAGNGTRFDQLQPDTLVCRIVQFSTKRFTVNVSGTASGNAIDLQINSSDLQATYNLDCSDGTNDTTITAYGEIETALLNQEIMPSPLWLNNGSDSASGQYLSWDSLPKVNWDYKVEIFFNQ